MKKGKIAELEALIGLNEMIIEDYSNEPNDIFYKGKVAENEELKKELKSIKND